MCLVADLSFSHSSGDAPKLPPRVRTGTEGATVATVTATPAKIVTSRIALLLPKKPSARGIAREIEIERTDGRPRRRLETGLPAAQPLETKRCGPPPFVCSLNDDLWLTDGPLQPTAVHVPESRDDRRDDNRSTPSASAPVSRESTPNVKLMDRLSDRASVPSTTVLTTDRAPPPATLARAALPTLDRALATSSDRTSAAPLDLSLPMPPHRSRDPLPHLAARDTSSRGSINTTLLPARPTDLEKAASRAARFGGPPPAEVRPAPAAPLAALRTPEVLSPREPRKRTVSRQSYLLAAVSLKRNLM